MIGALLSNTPVSLLRSSGYAGEGTPGSGDASLSRDSEPVRDSQASPRQDAIRTSSSLPLTPQAILALQDTSRSNQTGSRQPDAEDQANLQEDEEGTQSLEDPVSGTNPAKATSGNDDDKDGDGLNEAEEKQVRELAQRDREVKAHEQAHARVGGAYASAPSYTYQQGPDGKRYAIGGEVQIDTSTENSPEATIRKMQIVIRAATAPAEPSSQDLKVAQQARSQLSAAQTELRQQKAAELNGEEEGAPGTSQEASASDTSQQSPTDDASTAGSTDETSGENSGGSARQDENARAIAAYQSAGSSRVESSVFQVG